MQRSSRSQPARLAEEILARLASLRVRNVSNLRAIRRDFSAKLGKETGEVAIAVACKLLESERSTDVRLIAYELITKHKEALGKLGERDLKRLGRGIDSWAAVDTFACYLSGQAWRERQVPDALIHQWATSKDRWWRRAALVSTVPLNMKSQGGSGDTDRTLEVCRLLMNDRDDMVVKALSWALRALSRSDSESVSRFLADNQERLAALVIREVRNKLQTGLKNPKKETANRRAV